MYLFNICSYHFRYSSFFVWVDQYFYLISFSENLKNCSFNVSLLVMNCFSFCTYKIIFIFLLLKDTFCWYRNLGRISYWSQYIEDIASLPSHIVSEDKLLPSLFLLFYIKCPVFSSFLYNFFSLSLWVLNNLTMVCAMV